MHVTADRGRRSYMDRSLVRFTCMVAWEKKIFKNCCGETKNKNKIKIKITSVAEKKSWLYPRWAAQSHWAPPPGKLPLTDFLVFFTTLHETRDPWPVKAEMAKNRGALGSFSKTSPS